MTKDTIGIDVSKDRLDAFWYSRTEARCLPNTPEGFGRLCDWRGKEEDVLIVFEATDACHRRLGRHLSLAGLPFIKVNPKQVRRFAQSIACACRHPLQQGSSRQVSAVAQGRQGEEGRHYGQHAAHYNPRKHLAAREVRLAA